MGLGAQANSTRTDLTINSFTDDLRHSHPMQWVCQCTTLYIPRGPQSVQTGNATLQKMTDLPGMGPVSHANTNMSFDGELERERI